MNAPNDVGNRFIERLSPVSGLYLLCQDEKHFPNIAECSKPVETRGQHDCTFLTADVERCNDLLRFNKEIIASLLNLKTHLTLALRTCERKLATIERGLQTHAVGGAKALICNAGMPYFKDRNYFFASNNEDDVAKENRRELQLRDLPKVSPWTKKDRDAVLRAIREEAIADVLSSRKIDQASIDKPRSMTRSIKDARKQFSSIDFSDAVGPLPGRDFDWLKISSIHFEDVHSPIDCRVMWNVFLHPDINKNSWTKWEDAKLKEIAEKHGYQDWDTIAKELNTNRTAYQCFIRYNTTKKLPKVKNCGWRIAEDKKLLKLIDIFKVGDFIPWGEIASWMKGRTKQQIYFRWTYSLAPYLTKGRFTKAEDDILRDAVFKYGTNFRKISAAFIPNRSTVQLHDRYQTLITNQVENWNLWTPSEDAKLLHLFGRLGPDWSTIAKEFSCKTRTQLRHRHAALQRYIKRGFSLLEIHQGNARSGNGEESVRPMPEEPCENLLESDHALPDIDSNSDVDKELLEYFWSKCKMETIVPKRKFEDTVENVKCNATILYNILNGLKAKLCIPDDIGNVKMENTEMQLLYPFKEYVKLKNDRETYHEYIDRYRMRMFSGSASKEECLRRFVPPPPFESRIKLKRSKGSHDRIDYNLDAGNKFLLQQTTDFDTPDLVISLIGGAEPQLQFQKLSRAMQLNDSRHRNLSRKTLPARQSNDTADPSIEADCRKMPRIECVGKANALFDDVRETLSSSSPSSSSVTLDAQTSETNAAYIPDASYATLLCYKNLMRLVRLNGKCSSRFEQHRMHSSKFQEAFSFLETRLEQLLKYPIGLSKIVLPEVYVADTFSSDDITRKRKAPAATDNSPRPNIKTLRTLKGNRRTVR